MDVLSLSWVGLGLAAASLGNLLFYVLRMRSQWRHRQATLEKLSRTTLHEISVTIDGKTTTTIFEGTEGDVNRLREGILGKVLPVEGPSDSSSSSGNKNGSVA